MRFWKYILIAVAVLLTFDAVASDKLKVVKERAQASIPIVNISPEMARAKAIEEAKKSAIVKAVGEQISIGTTVLQSEQSNAFAQMSSIESRGGIVGIKFHTDGTTIIDKVLHYVVDITCEVKIYDASAYDNAIAIDVTGIKPAYKNGERLTFGVKASDSCYIYIFLLDNKGGAFKLIPSTSEPYLLPQHTAVNFPVDNAIQYTLYIENSLAQQEDNNLLVVGFRNKQYPKAENIENFEKLSCWIYNFDPSQRSNPLSVSPIRIFER